jgi:hypothetical protein
LANALRNDLRAWCVRSNVACFDQYLKRLQVTLGIEYLAQERRRGITEKIVCCSFCASHIYTFDQKDAAAAIQI